MMGIKNLHFDEKETLAKLDNMLYNGENSIFDMKDEKDKILKYIFFEQRFKARKDREFLDMDYQVNID